MGVELDGDTVERLGVERKEKPYPAPGLLIAIRRPSGPTSYYAHTRQYCDDFLAGRLPVFPDGVSLEQIADDGRREWRELHERAQHGGVHVSASA